MYIYSNKNVALIVLGGALSRSCHGYACVERIELAKVIRPVFFPTKYQSEYIPLRSEEYVSILIGMYLACV